MPKLLFLSLSLAILSMECLAQADPLDVFESDLPASSLESTTKQNEFSSRFSEDMMLHPLLAKPLIEFVEARELALDYSEIQSKHRALQDAEISMRLLKNEWIDSVITHIIDSEQLGASLTKRTIKQLSSKKSRIHKKSLFKFPFILSDSSSTHALYYVYKYLSLDRGLHFEEQWNYKELVLKIYAEKRWEIYEVSQLVKPGLIKFGNELIYDLVDQWFIFGDVLCGDESRFKEAAQIIIDVVNTYYSIRYESNFSASVSTMPYQLPVYLERDLKIPGANGNVEIVSPLQDKQIIFNLGYNVATRDKRGPFSHVAFTAYFSKHNSHYLDEVRFTSENEELDYRINIDNLMSYGLKVTTPIQYFWSLARIDLGLIMEVTQYDYSYSLRFEQPKVFLLRQEFDIHKVQFRVLPFVSTIILPLKTVRVRANWSTNFVELGMSINVGNWGSFK
ncbi:MAG: hypothetical protein HQ556_14255 [Candidatus Marinimicrobia bacterium]|nr:hypothetical protein [Candidatus Neomarinimicrobiota bacterium]